MNTTTYHVVRVNTHNHPHVEQALDDMAYIIERGFFWKKSDRFYCPVGSPIIAMGSRGGRGLFLFGMVNGQWEDDTDNAEYHQRIPVLWQPVIYQHPSSAVDVVASMLPVFNHRFGSRDIDSREFARVFAFVAGGDLVTPDYHWQTGHAA